MEFLDKIGKKATDTYKATAEKTTRLARETKLKMEMNVSKANIAELYEEIGKKVYEKHRLEQEIDIEKELIEECTKIDVLADQIENARMEILSLRDKKQCPKCYVEIELGANYCPNCGEKQRNTEEQKKEEKEEKQEMEIINQESTKEKEDEVNMDFVRIEEKGE